MNVLGQQWNYDEKKKNMEKFCYQTDLSWQRLWVTEAGRTDPVALTS